jgi:uncharacterized protein YecE (DUF72 family)
MLPRTDPTQAIASIGTVGFSYGDWEGIFYPEWLPTRDWFHYYASKFNSIEINLTFYRWPTAKTFENWKRSAPPGFCFVLKASRTITHEKRLQDCSAEIERLVHDYAPLGPQLSCILFQLPPSVRANHERLQRFLQLLARHFQGATISPHLAWEFRNQDWNTPATLDLLASHGCAMVIHDMRGSGDWKLDGGILKAGTIALGPETLLDRPTPLLYLRFHGTEAKYSGAYGADRLRPWAELARAALGRGKPVHAYFNNTLKGAAVADALAMQALLA